MGNTAYSYRVDGTRVAKVVDLKLILPPAETRHFTLLGRNGEKRRVTGTRREGGVQITLES